MPYIVICKKADGSIEVAAHPGEAAPELLQDAQPAASVEEAVQMAQQVLSEGDGGDESAAHEKGESSGTEALEGASGNDTDDTGGGDSGAYQTSASDLKDQAFQSPDEAMAAGFKRAKKGY